MKAEQVVVNEIGKRMRRLRKNTTWTSWQKALEWGRILGLCWAVGINPEDIDVNFKRPATPR